MSEVFEKCLKGLVRNRNKPDLHSAMCYFKSGTVAYIYVECDKTITVILRDKEDTILNCNSVAEVVNFFGSDELVRFET